MKKLFFIALFTFGLATTLSAQSVTISDDGIPFANVNGHSEELELAWSIPGDSDMYELQLSGGGETYYFIVEIVNGVIVYEEFWEM